MSIENHPNFHAVNFTTQITAAFYESLRGKANKKNAPDISQHVESFCSNIEDVVDAVVDPQDDGRTYFVIEDMVQVMLDIDFCDVLGKYIVKHGSDGNAAIAAFGHQLYLMSMTPEQLRKYNIKEVKKLRKQNLSFAEIGEKLHISSSTAAKYYKQ